MILRSSPAAAAYAYELDVGTQQQLADACDSIDSLRDAAEETGRYQRTQPLASNRAAFLRLRDTVHVAVEEECRPANTLFCDSFFESSALLYIDLAFCTALTYDQRAAVCSPESQLDFAAATDAMASWRV